MKLKYLILSGVMVLVTACSTDFMDSIPKGKLSDGVLNTAPGIEGLCTAAYSALAGPEGNNLAFLSPTTNWIYGEVRGGNAYKGGGGITDIGAYNAFETFVGVFANEPLLDRKWFNMYISVQRCNEALRRMKNISLTDMPLRDVRIGEMKFLRAHYYFELSRLFNHIPYFDENVAVTDYVKISNVEFTRDQILEKISAEFAAAAELLPETQPVKDLGRVNKSAAYAYQAKVTLYRAFKQNDANNKFTGTPDPTLLANVVALCDKVTGHDLVPDYQFLATIAHEHDAESVFGVEYSVKDGTAQDRINWSNLVNAPRGPAYSGDGFFMPSQNLVNAFKTDVNGIPMFDTYNNGDFYSNSLLKTMTVQDGLSNPVDPRLDFTVGRIGIPWKDFAGEAYSADWSREPATYGYYSCKKFLESTSNTLTQYHWGGSALNYQIIRYADVLLWKAEALIELGRQNEALPLINRIRNRAKNSSYVKAWQSNNPAANYVINPYIDGVNCTWSQDFARKALRFERRLELAMEGDYFFDLVRWGVAKDVINKYFANEKGLRTYMQNATFVEGRDEYFPIPQNQISFSGNLYKQNPGYGN
jgi:SusD family.